jgi:hypothetical protein
MRLLGNSNGICFLEAEMFKQQTKIYINVNVIETVFSFDDDGLAISTTNGDCPNIKGTVAEFFDLLGCYATPTHFRPDDEVPF